MIRTLEDGSIEGILTSHICPCGLMTEIKVNTGMSTEQLGQILADQNRLHNCENCGRRYGFNDGLRYEINE